VAELIGYSSTFLVLGALGLIAVGLWVAFAAVVKQY
jgi:hypothetical protein